MFISCSLASIFSSFSIWLKTKYALTLSSPIFSYSLLISSSVFLICSRYLEKGIPTSALTLFFKLFKSAWVSLAIKDCGTSSLVFSQIFSKTKALFFSCSAISFSSVIPFLMSCFKSAKASNLPKLFTHASFISGNSTFLTPCTKTFTSTFSCFSPP